MIETEGLTHIDLFVAGIERRNGEHAPGPPHVYVRDLDGYLIEL